MHLAILHSGTRVVVDVADDASGADLHALVRARLGVESVRPVSLP